MTIDTNIWGLIAMPVGVAVCFGPALYCWLSLEYGQATGEETPESAASGKHSEETNTARAARPGRSKSTSTSTSAAKKTSSSAGNQKAAAKKSGSKSK